MNLFLATNKISNKYYTAAGHAFTARRADATVLGERELSLIRCQFLNVEAEHIGNIPDRDAQDYVGQSYDLIPM